MNNKTEMSSDNLIICQLIIYIKYLIINLQTRWLNISEKQEKSKRFYFIIPNASDT